MSPSNISYFDKLGAIITLLGGWLLAFFSVFLFGLSIEPLMQVNILGAIGLMLALLSAAMAILFFSLFWDTIHGR